MRTRSGYSLVEVLMVVAIVGTISSIAPQLFIQITRYFRQNQARGEIQRDARGAFELIGRNMRQAQASTIVIDQLTGQPPYSRVAFTKIDGRQLTYYQNGTKLYQVSGGTKAISENVRYVAFGHPRTDDNKLVTVTLTLEKATYNQQTKALQLSVEKFRVQND